MEDELLDNGEPIGASKPAPKKRGRKPKIKAEPLADGANVENSAPKKRAGRPRKTKIGREPDAILGDANAVPEGGEKSPEKPVDIIEAARLDKKRGGKRSLKRDDGPVWKDETGIQDDAQYDAGQTEIFEHKDSKDDFAYYAEPADAVPQEDSIEDADFSSGEKSLEDEDIPTSFSTSDEDLNPDSYRDRFDSEDDSAYAAESTVASEDVLDDSAHGGPVSGQADSGDIRQERRDRWNSQNQAGGQNRGQGGNNNRW